MELIPLTWLEPLLVTITNTFLRFFSDVDHFSKVLIEFVTILFLFYVLGFWP